MSGGVVGTHAQGEISRWLRLILAPGQVVELRALDCRRPGFAGAWTDSGYFDGDHLDGMAKAAGSYKPSDGYAPARGVYFTLNPVRPDLLARAANRVQGRLKETTADKDILCRRWLPLDFDAVRPSGISSTDQEKAQSLEVALAARAALAELGWPAPIVADSGNGSHLLYRIDLVDADQPEGERDLVRRVLQTLAARFDSEAVKVDTTVFNPARIWRLYGTWACKGDNLAGRPWRQSKVLEVPQALNCVPLELLQQFAPAVRPGSAPHATQGNSAPSRSTTTWSGESRRLDVPAWLSDRGVTFRQIAEPDGDKFQLDCPFDPAHKSPDAFIKQFRSGKLIAQCSHNSCTGRGWKQFKDAIEAPEGRHYEGVDVAASCPAPIAASCSAPAEGAELRQLPEAQTERPTILVTTEESRVNDQAISALAGCCEVFQRGHRLVRVLREGRSARSIHRPPGTPIITDLPPARVRELLTEVAVWQRERVGRGGVAEASPAHPPDWCVSALIARGEWESVRHLEGVCECPALRPDGSVLERPGYDPATGLLYEPSGEFPPVPSRPTRDDAVAAADALLALVADFPLVSPDHRAAWLAAALTPFARPAIAGPCPLFLIEASAAGSGKSLLADVIGLLATGRPIPRSSCSSDDEEVRKTITAIAIEGCPIVLLDNLAGGAALGSASLDRALTSTTWQDRILGRSERCPPLPLNATWFATANNPTLKADTHRRVIPIRLRPTVERPEERTGFQYPDLLAHVLRERGRLVVAALTVLRAFDVAGRPQGSLPAFGSFEDWSALLRQSVYWATGFDPWASRGEIRVEDRDSGDLAMVMAAWETLPGGCSRAEGVTCAQALKLAKDRPNDFPDLVTFLRSLGRGGDLPSSQRLASVLLKFRDRVRDGRVLSFDPCRLDRKGAACWFCTPI